MDAQREELRQTKETAAAETARLSALARMVALAAGIAPENVTIDRDHRRATAIAAPLPGTTLSAYRSLERRAAADNEGWRVAIEPPFGALPTIVFADEVDSLDDAAMEAVLTSAWAARRWNIRSLAVPGWSAKPPKQPNLTQRRAMAIASVLSDQGIATTAAAPAGQVFRLSAAPPSGR